MVDFSDEHIAFFAPVHFCNCIGKKKFLFLCAKKKVIRVWLQHDEINDMHDDRMYFFLGKLSL